MNKVIDSVGGSKESYQSVLAVIIESPVSLTQEVNLAKTCHAAYEEHGEYPSRDYLQSVFELQMEPGPAGGCKMLADQGINALYVDHVQLLKYYVGQSDGVQGVDRFVKTMTDVSVELAEADYDFRVIFLSQINRDSYKKALRRGGQYDLTAMAEYNELERSASYMVTLFSTDELKAVNEVRIQLLKHRLGATLEEPVSVFVDPGYSVIGGVSAMADFDATEDAVSNLLGEDFGF